MDANYKIQVKIGDAEFQAEGPEQIVSTQFDRFIDVIAARKAAVNTTHQETKKETADSTGNGSGTIPVVETPSVLALHERVFSLDDRAGLSLRVLPKTDAPEADAVMLILYGYATLRSQHDVLSVQIGKSAQQSGVNIDRLDRALLTHTQYVTSAGQKGGKKYGLNNRGLARAKELLEGLLA